MKAVLVIEVDEEDIGREVNYISVKGDGMSYIVGTMREGVRLRPLPKYDWHEEGKENECEEWYRNGWNACLDVIMGEAE